MCWGEDILGPQAVNFLERLSLFRSGHYYRFHCVRMVQFHYSHVCFECLGGNLEFLS